jgi:3-deoxy-manno-octulosonate cytidylyltransferase (CMP-KDO synthetase)
MIEHVWRRSQLLKPKIDTIIATDSKEIINLCNNIGATTYLTSKKHHNGLSRVGEVANYVNWDYYIILQADEILIDPKYLSKMIYVMKNKPKYDSYNLVTKLESTKELKNKDVVKSINRKNDTIINMFRTSGSVAPVISQLEFTKKVCGVFSISKNCLKKVTMEPETIIGKHESIEQMKLIELGFDILSIPVDKNYLSVNTETEANEVLKIIKKDKRQKMILRNIL